MLVSKKILSSRKTLGSIRIPVLIFSAEVMARNEKTEEVNALFEE
jgi:hypothetical protein